MWVQTVQGMFVTQDVYRGSMYLTILPLQCSNVNTIFTKLLIINNIQKNFAPASATIQQFTMCTAGNVSGILFNISISRIQSFPANSN